MAQTRSCQNDLVCLGEVGQFMTKGSSRREEAEGKQQKGTKHYFKVGYFAPSRKLVEYIRTFLSSWLLGYWMSGMESVMSL